MKIKYCIPFIFLFLSSCNYFAHDLGFDVPKIVSVTPVHMATGVASNATITASFSKKMNRNLTTDAFTLSSENGTIGGYFTWDASGTVMYFAPRDLLVSSTMYTITINSNAEDEDGNNISENYTSIFYVNNDITPPTVVSHIPTSNFVGADPMSNITITFSEAISKNTIFSGLSITPTLQVTYSWNGAGTVLTIDPIDKMTWGSTYTVSLSSAITDVNGNPLKDPSVFSFTVGDDFTPPSIVSAQQNAISLAEGSIVAGIEKQDDMVITFNEPVKKASMYDAITINPSVDFHIVAAAIDTTATIVFDEPMESETNYTLKISTGLTDEHGNPLVHDYLFRFFTDGPNSLRPDIIAIKDKDSVLLPLGGSIPVLPFENLGTRIPISFAFSSSIQPATFVVTLTKVAGTGSGSPYSSGRTWSSSAYTNDSVSFFINDVAPGNTYKLVIKGGTSGVRDTNGNYLSEDYVWYFKTAL